MKKFIIGAGVAALLTVGVAGPSFAAPAPLETCIPSEASTTTEETDWLGQAPEGEGWALVETRTVVDTEAVPEVPEVSHTEYLWMLEAEHFETLWMQYVITTPAQPAQGEPTITVDNPDYVAPWTETIEHPAVTETVHHEAVYETVHHEAEYKTQWKYTRHGGYGFIWVDNDDFKYIDENGVGYNSKWDIPWFTSFYERTQHTRQEKVKDAWDEQVLVTPAWDEEVEVTPAWTETIDHPAIGEPTITIDNPDYVPAVEEEGEWEYRWAETSPGEGWIATSKTRQIDSTWEYQWATEQPGDAWIQSSKSRVIVDQEFVPGVPAVTHEESRYSLTVTTPAVECPVEEEPPAETPEEEAPPAEEPPAEEPTVEEPPAALAPPVQQQRIVTPDVPVVDESLADTGLGDASQGAITLAALLGLAGTALTVIRRRLTH